MNPLFPHQVGIHWEVTVVEITREAILSPPCQKCRSPLTVHQPDENAPNRLLGTCGDCGTWHLIEVGPRGTKALLFSIPGMEIVRAKLDEGRKASEPERRARPKPEKRDGRDPNGHVG
jgi:hypothetical protein